MIKDLINQGESKTIEFKAELPNGIQVAKTVCAFANRAGGQIIFGVSDDRSVLGVDPLAIDETMDRLANIIHDQIMPMVLPEIFTYDLEDKVLIVVKVYPGNATPYYLKSKGKQAGTYLRVGAVNKQADLEMIQELERNRLNLSYDEDIARETEPGDLNRLAHTIESLLHRPVELAQMINMKMIRRIGDRTYFTHAADILIGVPEYCRMDCARFREDSSDEFIDRKEFHGNLLEQIESAMTFLKNHLFLRGTIAEGSLARKDQLEIPEAALREALINAVVHRDYSISGSAVKVAVYDHRVDIVSPGGFPKTITVDEIFAGRSEIRNKVIARIFREAGLVEAWGSGVARMVQACRAAGLQAPTIREEDLYVRLTFMRQYYYPVHGSRNPYQPQRPLKIREASKSDRTAHENRAILQAIQSSPDISQAELADILQISGAAVYRRLKMLQEQGLVRRDGSKKTGKWLT